MKNLVYRDLIKWYNYKTNESRIRFLKFIIHNQFLDSNIWTQAAYILENKLKKYSKVKIKNWCVITGNSHSVFSKFSLSRWQLKNLASDGMLVGVWKWNF